MSEPSFSPDRREIAFVAGGDIWSVAASGGDARLLVSNPGYDSRPLFSPDGTRLAFLSTRSGNGDIYVLTLTTGELQRITYDDVNDQLDAWSRDGEWLYFTSSSRDIAGMNDVYRVRATGGTPMVVAGDRYATEFFGAPSPDGQSLAISARGNALGQWWRRGHSHLDMSELHVVRVGDTPTYQRLGDGPLSGKELWPMWSADGRSLFFVGDRDGVENLWMRPATAGGTAQRLTSFTSGRVLWPQISADGKSIVFERDFGIWTYDVDRRQAQQVPVALRGAPTGASVEHLSLSNGIQELALSPDARKVAFAVRGELFAASAKDGGEAARVTTSPAVEGQVAWAPDSRRVVYASNRDGAWKLYLYDFATRSESALTTTGEAAQPVFSPDGKLLAWTRNGRELHLTDVATRSDRVLATASFDRAPFLGSDAIAFSPDSRWVAYLTASGRGFENAYVVPVSGGTGRQVSFLPNAFGRTVRWSPDGTYLLVVSGQRTESGQLSRIDLVPRPPRFREDAFRALFPGDTATAPPPQPVAAPAPRDSQPAARKAPPRTEIVFDDIRHRATLLPVGVDVNDVVISPDGRQALIVASAAGQSNLWLWSLDELARDAGSVRQLTSTASGKQSAQWSPDGKEVWYLESGRIQTVVVDTRATRALAVTAEMDVDFNTEKLAVLSQAWSYLRDNFFDDSMHGVDWDAVRERMAPRVAAARTPEELRRLLSLMVGELNASHLGAGGPPATPPYVGKLGVRFSRASLERDGAFRIETVIRNGPMARDAKVGEFVVAIDGVGLRRSTNLDALLSHKTGKRVVLRVGASASGDGAREIVVRPISTQAEKQLAYRAWVEERRAYVARVSNGRLGYVHMPDMGAPSLAQLYVDLDDENQAKEGVVIDLRNNNGGFVNAYALDVFARRPYLTMQPRGRGEFAARSQLGQRVYDRPTVLVVNQHSLSDAEDFTEGYRALGLGRVVGEPTAGWIIYTSNATLLDGTSLRLPSTRIRGHDGKDMELVPRPVDVRVDRRMGESYEGKDSQLDAAVAELLRGAGTR